MNLSLSKAFDMTHVYTTNTVDELQYICELDENTFTKTLTMIMTVIWVCIALIGILTNGCVLIVLFSNTQCFTVTQYFLISLALSDLLFLIICPTFSIINYNNIIIFDRFSEFLGLFICKLDYFSTHVSVHWIRIFNSIK